MNKRRIPKAEIGALGFADRLSKAGREKFMQERTILHFAENQIPIVKGDILDGAYIVESGRLRVVSHSPAGKEATLYAIHPGESCVLALNSLFTGLPYPATVMAAEATRVIYVPRQRWRELFQSEPEIQNLTLAAMSVAVMRLLQALDDVHAGTVADRLNGLLQERADLHGRVPLTQTQIAAELGTAREVVARQIAKLRRAGKLAGKRGEIRLVPRLIA